jgi:hypothetical protein
MKVYFVHLPKKKDICKGINVLSKYGNIGINILFFLGYPKWLVIGAVVVNSAITAITEQMVKN